MGEALPSPVQITKTCGAQRGKVDFNPLKFERQLQGRIHFIEIKFWESVDLRVFCPAPRTFTFAPPRPAAKNVCFVHPCLIAFKHFTAKTNVHELYIFQCSHTSIHISVNRFDFLIFIDISYILTWSSTQIEYMSLLTYTISSNDHSTSCVWMCS